MVALLWTCAALIGAAGLVALLLWMVYAPIVARSFSDPPWFPPRRGEITPDDYPEGVFDAERVSFETTDGVRLAGTCLPTLAADRKGVVIFCHEYRGSQAIALAFTSGLRDAGFDVLAFDFRDHGESQKTMPHGPLPWATEDEAADISAAIDFCCRRDSRLAGRIVLFGLSRGASAALCVAAADSRVQATILDSICPTERVQLHLIRRFMFLHIRAWPGLAKLPDWTLTMLAFWANRVIERQRGCRILAVDRAARRISKPVLMIHGGRDAIAPLETAYSLRKRMRNRPKMWVVSEARHNEAVFEVGEEYRCRVARFLTRLACEPSHDDIPRERSVLAAIMHDNATQCDVAPASI
ncbi:MAG: alpha/beta hydrolase [Patescibacteria group bacterium]|nr:alpha/beta hydrolase [Patescibacteria group bacterium]